MQNFPSVLLIPEKNAGREKEEEGGEKIPNKQCSLVGKVREMYALNSLVLYLLLILLFVKYFS